MRILAILLSSLFLGSAPMAVAGDVVNFVCTNADGKSKSLALFEDDLVFLMSGGRSARLNKGNISIYMSPRGKNVLVQDKTASTIESAIFRCVRAR